MTVKVGDKLPDSTFKMLIPEGVREVTTDELFAGKKVVLFAVPGAFTPTCSLRHLPGYVDHVADLKQKGVETIYCVAVNDPFVMDAWGKSCNVNNQIQLLSDGNGTFTKKIGLEMDGEGYGMGLRSQRYAMVVENNTVTQLYVEEPAKFEVSGAEAILANL